MGYDEKNLSPANRRGEPALKSRKAWRPSVPLVFVGQIDGEYKSTRLKTATQTLC
jgi:hypothetical protein